MRTLLVDNHDSYTFNLYQLIAEVNGVEPLVVTHDDPLLRNFRDGGFDNIVISPGPGSPGRQRDLGLVPELLDRTALPVLGVCLGHQAIAHAAGAEVAPAPQARHGHLTRVKHRDDEELFAGVPTEFIAVRYHSLCVQEPLPGDLEVTARAEDGVVMALRHRQLPRWGVQFHPESIASEHGRTIVANFRDLTARAHSAGTAVSVAGGASGAAGASRAVSTAARRDPRGGSGARGESEPGGYRVTAVVLPEAVDSEAAYLDLYAASAEAFWLDSSRVEPGLSRFSFLGDAEGPLSEVLTYRVGAGAVKVRDAAGTSLESGDIFDVLDRRLRERAVPGTDATDLPFDLTGGYVGYFGYEAKADCGAPAPHRAETPDAAWIFADRLVAVDHQEGRTYVVVVHRDDEQSAQEAKEWAELRAARLAALDAAAVRRRVPAGPVAEPVDPQPYLLKDQAAYQADVNECRRQLLRGESYEICLTNKVRVPFSGDDLSFYRRLREVNPAPYAALFRLGEVAVFCSSPERFLRIEREGRVESKPIKGTCRRDPDPARDAELAAELAADPKTQAENLMIVDLLRNDLGQVCEIGSVRVDRYMAVESYQTVHQLVSTIAGQLTAEVSAPQCVRHCFPGGSMTGAPKRRTMEIIDRLETEARGIYSGALGYFGLSGGTDLNIVIRTAVRSGQQLSIGAGGAIVLDSDPQGEFEEMLLKAAAPLRAWRSAP